MLHEDEGRCKGKDRKISGHTLFEKVDKKSAEAASGATLI